MARSGSLRVAWVSIRGEAMEQVVQQEVPSLLLEVVEVVVELPGETATGAHSHMRTDVACKA